MNRNHQRRRILVSTGKEIKALRKHFGDLPIKEAKANVYVRPNADDIKNGIPGDPERCALSLCVRRAYGAKMVLFLGSFAFIDLVDEKNRQAIWRLRQTTAGKNWVRQFDETKDKTKMLDSGLMLTVPSPSITRKAITKRNKEAARQARKAAKAGIKTGKAAPTRKAKSLRHSLAGKKRQARGSVTLSRLTTFAEKQLAA
jgi:hypothetical protein